MTTPLPAKPLALVALLALALAGCEALDALNDPPSVNLDKRQRRICRRGPRAREFWGAAVRCDDGAASGQAWRGRRGEPARGERPANRIVTLTVCKHFC